MLPPHLASSPIKPGAPSLSTLGGTVTPIGISDATLALRQPGRKSQLHLRHAALCPKAPAIISLPRIAAKGMTVVMIGEKAFILSKRIIIDESRVIMTGTVRNGVLTADLPTPPPSPPSSHDHHLTQATATVATSAAKAKTTARVKTAAKAVGATPETDEKSGAAAKAMTTAK